MFCNSTFQFGRFFKHLKHRVAERVASPEGQAEMKKHVQDVAVGVVAVYAVFGYGLNLTLCKGPSMEPTLHSQGTLVFVDIFNYRLLGKPFEIGDVVIAMSPTDDTKSKSLLQKASVVYIAYPHIPLTSLTPSLK
ncbi:S26 family signal peptidase [archaeon]|nr:MAG: S26 family signal peptidase [archaeon]